MRSSRSSFAVLLAVPLALGACAGEPEAEAAPAPEPMSQAGADAIRDAYAMAFMAKNAAGIAAFFAENGRTITADGKVVTGRAAIQEDFVQAFAAGYDSIGITSASFEASGDEAVDQGTFVLRMLDPKTKEATRYKGNYKVTLARQADGGFQIVQDSGWAVEEIR